MRTRFLSATAGRVNSNTLTRWASSVLVAAGMTLGVMGSAQALAITDVNAVFDDSTDRLQISGTVTSTSGGRFNEFLFDWDGAFNRFDFSGGSVLSSNLAGATFSSSAGNLPGGAFAVTGLASAPFSAPLFFDFTFQLPSLSANFGNALIDIGVCDDCSPGFVGGEMRNNIVRPTAGTISDPHSVAISEPGTLALLGLGLAGLGFARRRKEFLQRRAALKNAI
ncbi:PEP-CTERM sorting domain-containing protein [Pelagibius sp. Alg239-R121]|uniref:PEP-CTERM sorting domain-containing protein n=1 Tax=Pelagibius sp. Alg239-R121 TaxID=2993448 RepID=UPI0024A63B46|nr:PEP-CTERM sorting domain-containing protein [Pelagibius sp. Alg239-R121]